MLNGRALAGRESESLGQKWLQWGVSEVFVLSRVSAETKIVLVKKLHADKNLEIDDICTTLRISRSTFYRYVRL